MFVSSRALDSFDQYLFDVEKYPLIEDPMEERALAARARGLGTAWTTLHLVHEAEAAEEQHDERVGIHAEPGARAGALRLAMHEVGRVDAERDHRQRRAELLHEASRRGLARFELRRSGASEVRDQRVRQPPAVVTEPVALGAAEGDHPRQLARDGAQPAVDTVLCGRSLPQRH